MVLFRHRTVAWSLLAAWAAVIWYGSSLELGAISPFRLFGVDKLGHAAEYAILGLLAANALAAARAGGRGGPVDLDGLWQGAVLLAALWAWIDEIHQFTVPGRQTDPLDLLADIAGACLGAWLALRPWRRAASTGAGRSEQRTMSR
jgi:hypothetical protein